jgi:hypothetical protein
MRKITYDAARAFLDGKSLTIGNTHTDGTNLYLFGNRIATKENLSFMPRCDGKVKLTLAGWPTATTRERLNGVLELIKADCRVYQEKHTQFYGNTEIDDEDNMTLDWFCPQYIDDFHNNM